MSKRWSKLQSEIYNLIDDSINLQIHCCVNRMNSQRGSTDLPRYWISLDKEIIFDYPKQFLNQKVSENCKNESGFEYQAFEQIYPYITDIGSISGSIRTYIDAPLGTILSTVFKNDNWGLTDILKPADRRIGKQKLAEYFKETDNESVKKILRARGIV